MISSIPQSVDNAQITALRSAFRQAQRPIRWLFIAHEDSRLVESLMSGLPRESAVILQMPQEAWNFESGDLTESISWALHRHRIENLVLVGSTQASCRNEHRTIAASRPGANVPMSREKILASVQEHNLRNRKSQEEFSQQMRQLARLPNVRQRRELGELMVHGLLYRAESGLFLAYDLQSQTYRPLCV